MVAILAVNVSGEGLSQIWACESSGGRLQNEPTAQLIERAFLVSAKL
jgi:hypothetical protein